jgi:hypothetical protein
VPQPWIKIVEPADVQDAALYFIGKAYGRQVNDGQPAGYMLYSQLKGGKHQWSSKPGIAVKVTGLHARKVLADNVAQPLVLIEIPKDAATRWRKRR